MMILTLSAMQSGIQGTKMWKMDWDTLEKDNRWTNPLMGRLLTACILEKSF